VDIIFFPARRFFTLPRPPGALAARFIAAAILPPRVFFAILIASIYVINKSV